MSGKQTKPPAEESADWSEPTTENVHRALLILEEIAVAMKAPPGFFTNLASEGDWSFVIMSAALVEAVIGGLLEAAVPDRRLHPMLRSASLQGRGSKIEMAKALELLTPEQVQFVQQLASIRNLLLHRVENIDFSFAKYLGSLSPGDYKQYKKAIQGILPGGLASEDPDHVQNARAKGTVWVALSLFLLQTRLTLSKLESDKAGERQWQHLVTRAYGEYESQ